MAVSTTGVETTPPKASELPAPTGPPVNVQSSYHRALPPESVVPPAVGSPDERRLACIYRLTPSGQYTLLHTFPKGGEGQVNTMVEASDGNLYGATASFDGGGNHIPTVQNRCL
jgi:hypothetical protein